MRFTLSLVPLLVSFAIAAPGPKPNGPQGGPNVGSPIQAKPEGLKLSGSSLAVAPTENHNSTSLFAPSSIISDLLFGCFVASNSAAADEVLTYLEVFVASTGGSNPTYNYFISDGFPFLESGNLGLKGIDWETQDCVFFGNEYKTFALRNGTINIQGAVTMWESFGSSITTGNEIKFFSPI